MDIIQLISAAGLGGVIGSLLTALFQAWLNHRSYIANRDFEQKKEAYIGLIDSYRAAVLKSGKEEQKNFGFWAIRCELVANSKMTACLEEMKKGTPDQQEKAFKEAIKLMRQDLGIVKDK